MVASRCRHKSKHPARVSRELTWDELGDVMHFAKCSPIILIDLMPLMPMVSLQLTIEDSQVPIIGIMAAATQYLQNKEEANRQPRRSRLVRWASDWCATPNHANVVITMVE